MEALKWRRKPPETRRPPKGSGTTTRVVLYRRSRPRPVSATDSRLCWGKHRAQQISICCAPMLHGLLGEMGAIPLRGVLGVNHGVSRPKPALTTKYRKDQQRIRPEAAALGTKRLASRNLVAVSFQISA